MQQHWNATRVQNHVVAVCAVQRLSVKAGSAKVALWPCKRRRDVRNKFSHVPTTALADHPGAESTLISRQEYRRNVGICLVNSSGLVFAARRVDDTQGTWQMPQGGIDVLENPFVAATRELLEETGIKRITFVVQIDEWLAYDFPTTVQCSLTGDWTKYKGQTQKWMLYSFSGEDSEINLDYADKEFLEYKWAELEDLPKDVVQFKQYVYQRVVQHFTPYINMIKSGSEGSSTAAAIR